MGKTLLAAAVVLCVSWTAGHAQSAAKSGRAALSADDRAGIEALVAHYARALATCSSREYSELFTPDGVFMSDDFRGGKHRELYGKSAKLVGRAKLAELVETEEFCLDPKTRAARVASGGGNAARPPANLMLDATAEGAKGTIPLGSGGRYEDLYVKTQEGWRFASRSVFMPPAAPTKGAVVGTGVFTTFVENMDRTLAFYHDTFGMEVPPLPASGARPFNNPNPRLFAFFDIPGAKERHQPAQVPGTRTTIEVMEIQNVDHKTIPLRIQDPGTATPVLVVRDIDAMLGQLKQKGVPIVTPGGKPVTFSDGTRAVLVRDIDQRFIEIRQPDAAPDASAPAASSIVDMRLSIAVNDMDRTTRVYRDVLGFTLAGETAFAADKSMQALTGLANAEVRRSRVQAPGSSLWIELVEFRGVDRAAVRMRIQDRGAARLQLRTENIDALVNAVKSAGLTVVSQGAVAVPIPPNLKGALVADPNNFFVTLFESCDGCAPRTLAPQ